MIPIAITKDVSGIDWVTVWDKHISYDSVTGVAIGRDVLNDGLTIG